VPQIVEGASLQEELVKMVAYRVFDCSLSAMGLRQL